MRKCVGEQDVRGSTGRMRIGRVCFTGKVTGVGQTCAAVVFWHSRGVGGVRCWGRGVSHGAACLSVCLSVCLSGQHCNPTLGYFSFYC